MNVRERLKMLLEGDEGLKDLDTHLNQARAVQPAPGADKADPVESNKAKQGVSGHALPVDFDPENGMEYRGQFPLSYIRTHVVGELAGSEDKLLTIEQDGRPHGRTSKMRLDLSGLPKDDWGGGGVSDRDSDEEQVTAIPVSQSFTSAVTMARFPFKYLQGENSKRVNEQFYKRDKFWSRTWDLFVKCEIHQQSTSSLILTQVLSVCPKGCFSNPVSFDSHFPSSSTARGNQFGSEPQFDSHGRW